MGSAWLHDYLIEARMALAYDNKCSFLIDTHCQTQLHHVSLFFFFFLFQLGIEPKAWDMLVHSTTEQYPQ